MASIANKYVFLIFIVFIIPDGLKAQLHLSTHFDVGKNSVSNGPFVRNAGFIAYEVRKTTVTGGYQLNLKYSGTNFFSGSLIHVARQFTIKKFAFDIRGFFLYNPFSDAIHEINWGFLFKTGLKHFIFKLGTNFRTYQITQKAVDHYDITNDQKIHENWNLIYLLQYNLKPPENKWNAGIAVTNIDYFVINQETNPVIYIHGNYQIKPRLKLYLEPWFISAGAMNLAVNYFGFFIRTGLTWDLDLNK